MGFRPHRLSWLAFIRGYFRKHPKRNGSKSIVGGELSPTKRTAVQVCSLPSVDPFLMSSDFSDVILEAGGEEFPAHRVVLACLSPVFRDMFRTQMKEGSEVRVTIEDVDPMVVEEMLHYMYNQEVLSSTVKAHYMNLLKLADKYGIEGLKTKCAMEIAKTVTVSNALEVYILGETHNVKILMQGTLELMKRNKFIFLKNSETLRDLSSRHPRLAFQLALCYKYPPLTLHEFDEFQKTQSYTCSN